MAYPLQHADGEGSTEWFNREQSGQMKRPAIIMLDSVGKPNLDLLTDAQLARLFCPHVHDEQSSSNIPPVVLGPLGRFDRRPAPGAASPGGALESDCPAGVLCRR